MPLITTLLIVPLGGIALLYLFGKDAKAIKLIATGVSLIVLLLSMYMLWVADLNAPGFQLMEEYSWVPALGIAYKVAVDGISLPMIFLTTLLTFLVCVFSWDITDRTRGYYMLFLLLETALIGVFTALDLFLFYIFWELVLIPMYFIINIWGGPRKEYSAIKFFIYTFGASLFMLLGIMALYFNAGINSFDLTKLIEAKEKFAPTFQILVWLALFVGFVVKMPQVPVHTWLPDAHVEAPTGGSVLLAAVLLKMGSYGLIRISLPLLPEGTQWAVPLMLIISILSILYGALVCLAQQDLKRLVAYSSISHMGIVLLGIATLGEPGLAGAVYMMFAHGLISALLFMVVGAIQHSMGTRMIEKLSGLAWQMPAIGFIITIGGLASLGLPGLVQFVGEFIVFLATYQVFGVLFVLPVLTVVITAGYYLWALARAIFGPLVKTAESAHDASWYEFWPMLAIVVLIVLFGILPKPLLDLINTAILP